MNHNMRAFLLLAFILFSSSIAVAQSDPILPDRVKTPGDTLPVTKADVCTCNYTKRVRNVPDSVKRQLFADYRITPTPGGYEVDHLISLELGGSNDPKNLWPESYSGPNNAHVKDKLENKLHRLVCTDVITLEEAQKAISKDWIHAYNVYMDKPSPAFKCTSPRGAKRGRAKGMRRRR
jgi:hypothetical protein